jgi:ATP-dependent RNA helicase DDX42
LIGRKIYLHFLCCVGGRKGKGRGGGAGGKGVRGVDFGLGIGYSTESNNASSNAVPGRSAAVNSLRTGMMSQFRSSFVAASSTSQNEGFSNNTSMAVNKRPTLAGFVSGGSIGGDINTHQQAASYNPAPSTVNSTSQNSGVNPGQNNTNRLLF